MTVVNTSRSSSNASHWMLTASPLQVGIIRVPQHLHGQVKAGFFRPVFGMRVDRDRVIQAVLLDLTPYNPKAAPAASAGKSA